MSDGALSQDEIDSLLAGLDPSMGSASTPSPRQGGGGGGSGGISPAELKAFKAMMEELGDTHAQTLSMMTGKDVSFSPPQVDETDREGMLPSMPDEVLAIKVDMTGGIPGDHLFLLPQDVSIRIAALSNQDDTLSELDEMAISVVSESVSSMTGSAINTFTERTGNRSIQSAVADGAFGPKAIARFPAGNFVRVSYTFNLDGSPYKMWEVYSQTFVKDIAVASGVQPQGGGSGMQKQGNQGSMGGSMNMGGNFPSMGGMQNMGSGQQQMGYPQQMMGMGQGMPYQSPVMGMSQPNVQPVQFANLGMSQHSQESGNIGLIMDVYMELTVELGRTKKLIKDILGIGEGTIIELDKLAGEPVDILVNHKLIAKGEVVVIDENFGVRVTEIVSPMERMAEMS
jgi:flagellar motor switch protein FliN/FliY